MNVRRLALLGAILASACSEPSAPSQGTPNGVTFAVSGIVYSLDTTGRRPLGGAMVEFADSATATWGQYGRSPSDALGRYSSGPLTARQYIARASKDGYSTSGVVNLGYVDAPKTVDFELTTAGAASGPLSISAVVPTSGSTGGGTTVKITGVGFKSGAVATFDATPGTAVHVENSATVHVTAPAHGVGTVDVVVRNQDGETARLAGAYTYAVPQTFDFNGTWVGVALAHPELASPAVPRHSDMDLRLTIQNNALISATCGGSTIAMPSSAPAVSNGEFSLTGDGAMTGRIVSATSAVGTINTSACPSTRWSASKQ